MTGTKTVATKTNEIEDVITELVDYIPTWMVIALIVAGAVIGAAIVFAFAMSDNTDGVGNESGPSPQSAPTDYPQ